MKHLPAFVLALGMATLVACTSQEEDKAPEVTYEASDAATVSLNVSLM